MIAPEESFTVPVSVAPATCAWIRAGEPMTDRKPTTIASSNHSLLLHRFLIIIAVLLRGLSRAPENGKLVGGCPRQSMPTASPWKVGKPNGGGCVTIGQAARAQEKNNTGRALHSRRRHRRRWGHSLRQSSAELLLLDLLG